MTALFHALIHLARLRWLGAAFCALALLCVTTHASALAGATAHPRINVSATNAIADISTLAPATATGLSQPKDRVWRFEQTSPLRIRMLRSASVETRLDISATQREPASDSSCAARGAGQGFRSFSALYRTLGSEGPGRRWHHIVEQTRGNVRRFGAETIRNTQNVMKLDASVHRQISGFYSSKQPFTGGQTVRQWLSGQSLEQQMQFGVDTLGRFGGAP